MPLSPEQRAREKIDALLFAAGWALQDNADFNRNAAEGVAVREFLLAGGPCDYLLFVGGKAAGVIEAKKAGVTLSGVAEQAARYLLALPAHVATVPNQIRAVLQCYKDRLFSKGIPRWKTSSKTSLQSPGNERSRYWKLLASVWRRMRLLLDESVPAKLRRPCPINR